MGKKLPSTLDMEPSTLDEKIDSFWGVESCRNLCWEARFSTLDSAPTVFQLKIKEALHIEWEQPSLNKQLKHLNLSLLS